MRVAILASILPLVMKEGESKEGSSHFDKNSQFDRTLRYLMVCSKFLPSRGSEHSWQLVQLYKGEGLWSPRLLIWLHCHPKGCPACWVGCNHPERCSQQQQLGGRCRKVLRKIKVSPLYNCLLTSFDNMCRTKSICVIATIKKAIRIVWTEE